MATSPNQQAFEETLEAIKRLCRVLIHDINNPLSALSGYLQLCEVRLNRLRSGDLSAMDSLADFHNKMNQAVERICQIVQRLDQFSKILPMPNQAINLNDLWSNRIAERTAEEQQRINLICDSPSISMETHPACIDQIVFELLDNALVATAEGGTVTIEIRQTNPDRVEMNITNTGLGFDPAIIEKYCLPCYFTREEKTFPKKGMLIGIGLPIVHQFMHYLQGEMQIHSQPGQTTRIHLELPIA